jgi:hypothetical protein
VVIITSVIELDDPDGVRIPVAESDELTVAVGEVRVASESSGLFEP